MSKISCVILVPELIVLFFSCSGSPQSLCRQVSIRLCQVSGVQKRDVDNVRPRVVLATIVDKLNNPSPDDPFEPDIAAVSVVPHRFARDSH